MRQTLTFSMFSFTELNKFLNWNIRLIVDSDSADTDVGSIVIF